MPEHASNVELPWPSLARWSWHPPWSEFRTSGGHETVKGMHTHLWGTGLNPSKRRNLNGNDSRMRVMRKSQGATIHIRTDRSHGSALVVHVATQIRKDHLRRPRNGEVSTSLNECARHGQQPRWTTEFYPNKHVQRSATEPTLGSSPWCVFEATA